jgi:hypothetical protein
MPIIKIIGADEMEFFPIFIGREVIMSEENSSVGGNLIWLLNE